MVERSNDDSQSNHRHGLPFGPCTLTILNPQRRTHTLARYEHVSEADAVELTAVYQTLGYPDTHILLTGAERTGEHVQLQAPVIKVPERLVRSPLKRKSRRVSATQLAARRERNRKLAAARPPSVRLQKPNSDGYVVALLVNHPILGTCRVYEHQLVIIEEQGRPLRPGEIVHHVNHIRHDNRRENLELLKSAKEHKAKHPTIMTPEWKQHMREAKRRDRPNKTADELGAHMSTGHQDRQPNPDRGKRTSDAMKSYRATVKQSGTGA